MQKTINWFLVGGLISSILYCLVSGYANDRYIYKLKQDYETKLASKELQVKLTQSSYDECNKRYTEPRQIVCE